MDYGFHPDQGRVGDGKPLLRQVYLLHQRYLRFLAWGTRRHIGKPLLEVCLFSPGARRGREERREAVYALPGLRAIAATATGGDAEGKERDRRMRLARR